MQNDTNRPQVQPSDKEGYTSPDRAMRRSMKPFALAIVIALVAGIAVMVLWLSWDGAARDPGQMSAGDAGPSRTPASSDAEDTFHGTR